MPRSTKCLACIHPQRAQIDYALAIGAMQRKISQTFNVPECTLTRHKQKHLSPALVATLMFPGAENPVDVEKLKREEANSIPHNLRAARGFAWDLATTCQELKDPAGLAKAIKLIHENAEVTARVLGVVREGDQHLHLHLAADPAFARVVKAVVAALNPFPEAQERVVDQLRRLDETEGLLLETQRAEDGTYQRAS